MVRSWVEDCWSVLSSSWKSQRQRSEREHIYGDEEGTESGSPLEEVMEDIRGELIQRVAAADRAANRETYDALENE